LVAELIFAAVVLVCAFVGAGDHEAEVVWSAVESRSAVLVPLAALRRHNLTHTLSIALLTFATVAAALATRSLHSLTYTCSTEDLASWALRSVRACRGRADERLADSQGIADESSLAIVVHLTSWSVFEFANPVVTTGFTSGTVDISFA
jgi:hypothetical protein